jgi:hypothetical protein
MNRYAPPKAKVSDPPEISKSGPWVTPRGLALFFGFCSLWGGSTLFFQPSAWAVLVACLGATAAFGLWLQRPWSRWVVYLISMLLIVFSAWYFWSLVQGRWPYESGSRSLVNFLPGVLLLMFGVATPVHVARVFRKR